MNDLNLYLPELKGAFSRRKFFGKSDLRSFYQTQSPALSEKTFRRILYALETRDLIVPVDAGVYKLPNGNTQSKEPKRFIPTFSSELRELNNSVKTSFPYAEYMLWETRALHEFMLHQPGQGQIVLETEKEASESVFNFLNARSVGGVFLQPDRATFERYILPRPDSIIVTSLFTQSPFQRVDGIPTPKLEKILVDVFANEEIFYVFHGEELARIFETAFNRYRVSQKTLFRYAGRCKQGQKIRAFIQQRTNIQLIQLEEVSE